MLRFAGEFRLPGRKVPLAQPDKQLMIAVCRDACIRLLDNGCLAFVLLRAYIALLKTQSLNILSHAMEIAAVPKISRTGGGTCFINLRLNPDPSSGERRTRVAQPLELCPLHLCTQITPLQDTFEGELEPFHFNPPAFNSLAIVVIEPTVSWSDAFS